MPDRPTPAKPAPERPEGDDPQLAAPDASRATRQAAPKSGRPARPSPRIEGLFSNLDLEQPAPRPAAAPETPESAPQAADIRPPTEERPAEPGFAAPLPAPAEPPVGPIRPAPAPAAAPAAPEPGPALRPETLYANPGVLSYSRPGPLPGSERLPQAAATDTLQANAEAALVLEILDDPERIWSEDEILLVEQVTDQLSLALENARLFEEARLRAEQLAILNEMSRDLSAHLNIEEVIDTLYRYTSRLLDTTNIYVALPDEETSELVFQLDVEDGQRLPVSSRPLGDGLSEYLLHTRQPLLIRENVEETLERILNVASFGRTALSWLGVPMLYSDQAIGVVTVQSYSTPRLYDESHRDLLVAVASQAAVAIQNARLYTEERRRRQIADSFSEIARAISSTLDVSSISAQILEQLSNLVSYENASIRLLELPGETTLGTSPEAGPNAPASSPAGSQAMETTIAELPRMRTAGWSGMPARRAEADGAAFDPGAPPPALERLLLEKRTPVLVADAWTEASLSPEDRQAIQSAGGPRSWMAVPLLTGDALVGLICAGHTQPLIYNRSALELLNTISAQISVGLQNARLFEQTERARDALELSARYQTSVAQAVAALTERGIAALSDVLSILGQAANASRAYYIETQVDERGPYWRLIAEWHTADMPSQLSNPRLRRLSARWMSPWIERLRASGYQAAVISLSPPAERAFLEELGVRSLLQFAVSGRRGQQTEDIPGCIGFEQAEYERRWSSEEIAALQTAASALSNTIAREELFTQVQVNLAETEAQYQASALLNAAHDYDSILNVLREHTILGHTNASSITLNLFDHPITQWSKDDPPLWLSPIARWTINRGGRSNPTAPAAPANPAAEYQDRYLLTEWPSAAQLLHPERPTVIDDAANDPRLGESDRSPFADRSTAKSLLYIPLNVSGRWIGQIIAVYRQTTGFPDSEIRRLMSLAGQAAVAIEGLRLLDETRQRNEELATVNQITGAVSHTLELDEVLTETLQRVLATIQFSSGLVTLADPIQRRISPAVAHKMPEGVIERLRANGMQNTPCDLVYQTGDTIYIPDLEQYIASGGATVISSRHPAPAYPTEIFEGARQMGFASYLGVPLESKGIRLGTVCTFHPTATQVPQSRIELLRSIGQQVGVVVDNARLFQSTQNALSETETLYQASAELNASQSYDDVLQTLRRYTLLGTADQILNISLFNRPWLGAVSYFGSDPLSMAGATNILGSRAENIPEWITPVSYWTSLPPERLRQRYALKTYPAVRLLSPTEPVIVDDIATDPRLDDEARRLFQETFEARSSVFVPLYVGGLWIGFVNGAYSELTQFTDQDLRRLIALAGQAAVVVQNLSSLELAERRAQEAQRRSEELAVINNIVTAVSASLDLQNSLQLVCAELANAIQAYTGIALLDRSRQALRVVTNASPFSDAPDTVGMEIPLEGNASSQQAINSRRTVLVEDPQNSPLTAAIHETLRELQASNLMILPLVAGSEVIGTVVVEILQEQRNFSPEEVRLAETIVLQAATAIQNARLFEQTQKVLADTEALYQASAGFQAAHNYDDLLSVLRTYTLLGRQASYISIDLLEEGAEAAAGEQSTENDAAWFAPEDLPAGHSPVQAASAEYGAIDILPARWREGLAVTVAHWEASLPLAVMTGEYSRGGTVIPGDNGSLRSPAPGAGPAFENLLFIEDIASDPRLPEPLAMLYMQAYQASSALFVPLAAGGRQIGALVALFPVAPAINEEEGRRISALASQAAVTIQNLRLLEESRRRADQLQTAAEIARDTSGTLALEMLLQRSVNLLSERFGYELVSLYLRSATGEGGPEEVETGGAQQAGDSQAAYTLRAASSWTAAGQVMPARSPWAGETEDQAGARFTAGDQSLAGQAVQASDSVLSNDLLGEATYYRHPLLPEAQSGVAIPLKTGEAVIGVLLVLSRQSAAFKPDDVAVLQILGDQLAVAVNNARSYELAQKAVEEIREADRLKSQFLANMSHELRTPLNSIIGFSRVILKGIDGPVNELQSQDLTAIYNSGQHLLGLINDVLDLSKIEAGKMELSFENNTRLGDIINSVMSTTVGLVKGRNIELRQQVDPELPRLSIDPMKIRQVLINLLSNAAKFTDEGSITVQALMAANPETGASEVLVNVIDTGPGIAAKDQVKLFQPFSQVDGSLTRKTGGSGLGLSICQHLIRMHGGRIGLNSEEGKGSTFYFTLPVNRPAESEPEAEETLPAASPAPGVALKPAVEAPAPAAQEKPAAAITPAPGIEIKPAAEVTPLPPQVVPATAPNPEAEPTGPAAPLPAPELSPAQPAAAPGPADFAGAEIARAATTDDALPPGILLAVDQDPQVIAMYRRYLTGHDITIISLTDLSQVATVARGIQPQAITLDIGMQSPAAPQSSGPVAPPGPDGWKVLKWLKSDPGTAQIPVIICSVLAQQAQAFELGASEYLLKPILEEDLIQALVKVLAK